MCVHYVSPEYNKTSFNCPHCGVLTTQWWWDLQKKSENADIIKDINYKMSTCFVCGREIIWSSDGTVVYPKISIAPLANPDMPKTVLDDYNEARIILSDSPRGAAALLRLVIEKLLIVLNAKGKNLDLKIGYLVKTKKINEDVQQALDSLRVIGNESVHPGLMDLRDDPDTAISLFMIVNTIIERTISQGKEIKKIYDKLPDSKKEGIKIRDKHTSKE